MELRVLGPVEIPTRTLASRQGAYLLLAKPDRLDLSQFRRLVVEAASGNDEDRAAALRAALAGLSSPWARTVLNPC